MRIALDVESHGMLVYMSYVKNYSVIVYSIENHLEMALYNMKKDRECIQPIVA